MKKFTARECQSKIFKAALNNGVSPRLIAARLLSVEDKEDMQNGDVSDDALDVAVKVWIAAGMPDYANGIY